MLDKVVVLVQGRLAYYGPGTKFLEYFKAESPPDVYDDLTDNNTVSYALELKKKFQSAPLFQNLVVDPQKDIPAEQATPRGAPGSAQAKERGFSLRQFTTLLQRTWELKFSDRAQTLLLFGQAPAGGFARSFDGERTQPGADHLYGDVFVALVRLLKRRS